MSVTKERRVAVFGPSGMLGKHVMRALKDTQHVVVPVYRQMVQEPRQITKVLEEQEVEVVINCMGVIPSKAANPIELIQGNAIFPHILANCARKQLVIHISTDCVFSGRNRYRYKIEDIPDPRDYYGKSKAMGEVAAPNVLNVRTSFIGCEHGFMNWLFSVNRSTSEHKKIMGYKSALWTGSTVQAVAESITSSLLDTDLRGICHLATQQVISKHDLAVKLIELNNLDIEVEPVYHPIINRSLIPTIELPDIDTALETYKCPNGRDNVRDSVANLQSA